MVIFWRGWGWMVPLIMFGWAFFCVGVMIATASPEGNPDAAPFDSGGGSGNRRNTHGPQRRPLHVHPGEVLRVGFSRARGVHGGEIIRRAADAGKRLRVFPGVTKAL